MIFMHYPIYDFEELELGQFLGNGAERKDVTAKYAIEIDSAYVRLFQQSEEGRHRMLIEHDVESNIMTIYGRSEDSELTMTPYE